MDLGAFFIDLLLSMAKYVLSGVIVVGVAYWLFWKRYDRHVFQLKLMEAKRDQRKDTLPLRLQAYERVILFIERINPANLFTRLYEPGLDAVDFQHVLVQEIRAEYQHNIAQQLYLSDNAWAVVKQLKENTVTLIRRHGDEVTSGVSAKEFSANILRHLSTLEENPYDLAIQAVKRELND